MKLKCVIVCSLVAVWRVSDTSAAVDEDQPVVALRALFAQATDVVAGEVVAARHGQPGYTGRACSWLVVSLRVENLLKGSIKDEEVRVGGCTETFLTHKLDGAAATAPAPGQHLVVFVIPETRIHDGGWEHVPLRGGVFEAGTTLLRTLDTIGSDCWKRVELPANDLRQSPANQPMPAPNKAGATAITLDDGRTFRVSRELMQSLAGGSKFEVRRAVRSPDGLKVAVEIWGALGSPQIAIIDVDDRCAPILPGTTGAVMSGGVPFAAPSGEPRSPVWLDAKTLAFLASYEDSPSNVVYTEDVKDGRRYAKRLTSPAKYIECSRGQLTAVSEKGRATDLREACGAPTKRH